MSCSSSMSVAGVVGRGLHRDHARRLLGGHVLGDHLVDDRLDVAAQHVVEQHLGVGLVDVVPEPSATSALRSWPSTVRNLGIGSISPYRGSCFIVLTKLVKKMCTPSIRRPGTCRASPSPRRSAGRGAGGRRAARRSTRCWRRAGCMKPSPLLPSATSRPRSPSPVHSLCCCSTSRSTLVLRPPHRPLSVVITMTPTRFTSCA